jgi:hypothetical protein
VTPVAQVMEQVAAQALRGARHITFGDPDFLNGPRHATAVAASMRERFPGTSFDVTAKVEHLLAHRDLLPMLARSGCVFIVSAVESLSDRVLAVLDKGHTRADALYALELCRAAGLALRPSLLPFTPWSTLADYLDLLDWIEREGLVRHVDPVQLSIRLLVPPGSLLEHHPEMRPHLRELVPRALAYRWEHPDPRMDALARDVLDAIQNGVREKLSEESIFAAVCALADAAAGAHEPARQRASAARVPSARHIPRLTEPWFC